MRIVSWNIENLSKRLAELPRIVERLGNPDVLCLQEARIREQDRALLDVLPGYACHASLPRDPKNVTFRGGRAYGAVTYVATALGPARAEVPEWDREGRIVITHLDGLAIGNVYAVNGTDKPYFDHEQGAISGEFCGAQIADAPKRASSWQVTGTSRGRSKTSRHASAPRSRTPSHARS